jgi:hypothetical protein
MTFELCWQTIKSSYRPDWTHGKRISKSYHEYNFKRSRKGSKICSTSVRFPNSIFRLVITHLDKKSESIYPPLPAGHSVLLAKEAKLMVLRYRNYLDVWRLGASEESDLKTVDVGSSLSLKQEPVKVLTLRTKDGEAIRFGRTRE